MKIGILTTSYPNYLGDIKGIFIYNLSKELVKNNVEVIVVSPFEKECKNKNEEIDGIKIERFNYFIRKFQTLSEGSIADNIKTFYGKIQIPFFSFFYLIKAIKIAKRVDLFHCQWIIPSGFIAFIIKKIYKKSFIVTTRGSDLLLSLNDSLWKKPLLMVLNNADYVTSNNNAHIEELKKITNQKKVILMPNGIDYNKYKPQDKEKAREKLNLDNKSTIILFIGFLIERKRIDVLINVFSNLSKKYDFLKLVIVGDGPLRINLENLVKSLNLFDKVIFTGDVEPDFIPNYMNSSDIFVLPSSYEGRPNVIIEAMACKLPIVTTNVGDLSKLIKQGKEGFLVNNNNELYFCIEKLLLNHDLRYKLANNAFNSVKKNNPTWSKCAKEYIKLYRKILKN